MNGAILRQARRRDMPEVYRLLKPWIEEDSQLAAHVAQTDRDASGQAPRCTLLDVDRTIRGVCVSALRSRSEARLLGLAADPEALSGQALSMLLAQEILDWAEFGLSRVAVDLPASVDPLVSECLRACGFVFEGVSSGCSLGTTSRVRMAKQFLYRSIPRDKLLDFLREFMLSLGYELRPEESGFRYRVRDEHRRPFLFSPWHRLTMSGTDIVISPPARLLLVHELETIFYPLRIIFPRERPMLLPMSRQRAEYLIDLPRQSPRQKSLFRDEVEASVRRVPLRSVTYCAPGMKRSIRKGLPILFYVNRVGAVGTARVQDWFPEDPKELHATTDEEGLSDLNEILEIAASGGEKPGKIMMVAFQWYRSLHRPVTIKEIHGMDESFNPQRNRSVSTKLFDWIVATGNRE